MTARLVLGVALAAAALAGCDQVPPPEADAPSPPARLAGSPAYEPGPEPAEAVLPLVPAAATELTVTDLDEVRRQLGVPDLTGEDPVTDRVRFWDRAAAEAPLLTEGLLRPDESELWLDHGFSEDDVDWEAHFTGPAGNGFVLAFRPGLDMAAVRGAVDAGVGGLAGGRVLAADHLVVAGTTADGARSWATDPSVVGLVGDPAESVYVRRGCVPADEALGPDATAEQVRSVQPRVAALDDLAAFAVGFGDHLATVRVEEGRGDLFDRMHLGERWPAVDPAFSDGFRRGVADPGTGRIGFDVPRPPAAAALTLTGVLPFGVCPDVTVPPEPTGL